MHVYSDIAWALGEAIDADDDMGGVSEILNAIGSLGAAAPGSANDAPAVVKDVSAQGTPYKTLSPDTRIELRPRPPVPYHTWSDTWSYADPGE
jgi:hypothetical protein